MRRSAAAGQPDECCRQHRRDDDVVVAHGERHLRRAPTALMSSTARPASCRALSSSWRGWARTALSVFHWGGVKATSLADSPLVAAWRLAIWVAMSLIADTVQIGRASCRE